MTETVLEKRYRKTLEHIRDFCKDKDFNIYCSQILQTVEHALKLEEDIAKTKKPFTPPRYDEVYREGTDGLMNLNR